MERGIICDDAEMKMLGTEDSWDVEDAVHGWKTGDVPRAQLNGVDLEREDRKSRSSVGRNWDRWMLCIWFGFVKEEQATEGVGMNPWIREDSASVPLKQGIRITVEGALKRDFICSGSQNG